MEARFWTKVNKTETCWLWTAHKDPDGYGQFLKDGIAKFAHKVSWLLAGNEIPEGHVICHAPHEICGNRHCVNPAHLRADTKAANNRDMVNDGTSPRGTKNASCKLTENQVRAIRANSENKSQRELATEFGVSQKTISNIITHQRWSWLSS